MKKDELAYKAEEYLIPASALSVDPSYPDEINKFIRLANGGDIKAFLEEYGGLTGVARHPEYGWILLGSGQGPFIIWMESGHEDF